MIPAQLIAKKRDGQALSVSEIEQFVTGYCRNEIPDYQMAALAMAICLRGMTAAETIALTRALLDSGRRLTRASDVPRVDKHSTGGLGDKVSLILAPLLAACGLHVPMISGRGLGATGGTLDKLEAIPGLQTQLTLEEIQQQTETIGCVIAGASDDLVPADRRLYALRDVTATVESVPLITASILSKKLAESLDALVLDVKFGSGAFMKSIGQARQLAQSLVQVGQQMGTPTVALLTDMNQPLGRAVGNALEVDESIAALQGDGPDDLMDVVLALGSELLLMQQRAASLAEARHQLTERIADGSALARFAAMVQAQGGDLDAPRKIADKTVIAAQQAGYVQDIDGQDLGLAVIALGGGRRQIGDPIDHSVGLEMHVRIGDAVQPGQPLLTVYAQADAARSVEPGLRAAIRIGPEITAARPLIAERVSA